MSAIDKLNRAKKLLKKILGESIIFLSVNIYINIYIIEMVVLNDF